MKLTMKQMQLVEDNLMLVHHVLHTRYMIAPQDYDEYFQIGCEALCCAAIKFQTEKGYAFSTYAVPCITHAIGNALRQNHTTQTLPIIDEIVGSSDVELHDHTHIITVLQTLAANQTASWKQLAYQIFALLFAGYEKSEILQMLHLRDDYYRKIISRLLPELRKVPELQAYYEALICQQKGTVSNAS